MKKFEGLCSPVIRGILCVSIRSYSICPQCRKTIYTRSPIEALSVQRMSQSRISGLDLSKPYVQFPLFSPDAVLAERDFELNPIVSVCVRDEHR